MLSERIKKHLAKLQQKKFRAEEEEFIIEGIKGVDEALNASAEVVLLVIEGNRRDEPDIQSLVIKAEARGVPIEFCGRKDIGEIKTTDTFPGILAIIRTKEIEIQNLISEKIICLDGIKDPGNLGTIIRTADWFGIKNILLSEDCVDTYNPKVVRSTMGSIFHCQIMESQNIIKDLLYLQNHHEYKIYSLTMNGENFDKLEKNKKVVYIIGSESHGVRPEIEKISDKRYTIHGQGQAESLNAAVAAGILMSKIYDKN